MEPQTLNNEIVKQFFIPQFILKSLECELEMKVIILFYGNSVNKTHDLEVLFNLLPEFLKMNAKKYAITILNLMFILKNIKMHL